MKRLQLSICLVLLVLLLVCFGTLRMQANVPLLLQIDGDYWAWSVSGLQQRTNWGHNQDPIISPNGQQIAYKATAQLAVDALKGKGLANAGALPVNIWLLDVATGAPTRINDQLVDA